MNTVFAAYMNYNKADNRGEFNTPGILLTDAVMFALGGSHLELGGDHMLCKEYFPNENLTMSEEAENGDGSLLRLPDVVSKSASRRRNREQHHHELYQRRNES